MIFNARRIFRGRAQPELDSSEPMLLVELAGGTVFLVRVELQSVGMQCLGKENETCSPAFAPLGRVDEHPVDVGARHREKGNSAFVAGAHPDIATRANHFSE